MLKGFGLVKVFRLIARDGNTEHWATNKLEMSDLERVKYACYVGRSNNSIAESNNSV